MDETLTTPTTGPSGALQEVPASTTSASPVSARDVFLGNDDILTTIFSHFTPQVPCTPEAVSRASNEGRKQLLALARTCKSFSDPALTYLWSQISDLSPLFRLFAYTKEYNGCWVSVHRWPGYTLLIVPTL